MRAAELQYGVPNVRRGPIMMRPRSGGDGYVAVVIPELVCPQILTQRERLFLPSNCKDWASQLSRWDGLGENECGLR